MTLPDLLIIALAAWYLAVAIALTHGPWHIFEALRKRLPLGGLTQCVYCLMPWLAALGYVIMQTEAAPVMYVLAAAGLGIFAHRWTGGDML